MQEIFLHVWHSKNSYYPQNSLSPWKDQEDMPIMHESHVTRLILWLVHMSIIGCKIASGSIKLWWIFTLDSGMQKKRWISLFDLDVPHMFIETWQFLWYQNFIPLTISQCPQLMSKKYCYMFICGLFMHRFGKKIGNCFIHNQLFISMHLATSN
jgi:hypothetical protein